MTSQIFSISAVILDLLIVLVLIPRVIIQRRESSATIAWLLMILLVPLLGAVLYVTIGKRRLRRRRTKRHLARARLDPNGSAIHSGLTSYTSSSTPALDYPLSDLARSCCIDMGNSTAGNEVQIFHDGEQAFKAICEAIDQAERYIHLEYYIFQGDATGEKLLALLEKKAKEGLEVRLLVDAVGAWALRKSQIAGFVNAGGKFAEFLPVALFSRPFSLNLRNHRKIIVIDGHTAFTGGMNIGDEYRSRSPEIGHWRDTHALVRGPAALRLQEIFAEDWYFTVGENCLGERYLAKPQSKGNVLVEVLESGPDCTADLIYRRLFIAITRSETRVWLTTPYFIPDRAIAVALVTAAERGVDVRLLLPGWSDHRFVLYAGRAYYEELLQAGVKIYEYKTGMLHAKTMVVDDSWVTIGSANMDRRSFHLNWEANLLLLNREINQAMADRFERDLLRARKILFPYRPSLLRRFGESASFLLAPLL